MAGPRVIYVVQVRDGRGLSVTSAFECRECAQFQADWIRRDRAHAEVTAINLYEHIRGAVAADCPHVKKPPAKLSSVEACHPHIPVTL